MRWLRARWSRWRWFRGLAKARRESDLVNLTRSDAENYASLEKIMECIEEGQDLLERAPTPELRTRITYKLLVLTEVAESLATALGFDVKTGKYVRPKGPDEL